MMFTWLKLNLVFALLFVIYKVVSPLFRKEEKQSLSKSFLCLLPVTLILPIVINLIPVKLELSPVQKVSMEKGVVSKNLKIDKKILNLKTMSIKKANINPYGNLSLENILMFLFLTGLLFGSLHLLKSLLKLRALIKESYLFKANGNFRVLLSDRLPTPVSFQLLKSYVILPTSMLADSSSLRLALRHEVIHHKMKDPMSSVLLEALGLLFYLNPFFHAWKKEIFLQMEIRCDKKVLSWESAQFKPYANLLVRTARGDYQPQTLSLAMAWKGNLKRRIEVFTAKKKQRGGSLKLKTVLALSLAFVCASAYAARNNYQLKKLSMTELQQMTSQMKSEIPIDVNPQVLKWVNHYLGTEGGRAYLVSAKARYEKIKPELLKQIKKEKMPVDLIGVPLMESGYISEAKSTKKAAGIWQFIPGTAKRFGLKVNAKLDERLNLKKSTKAAMSYYKALMKKEEFSNDWRLALLAYNSGERSLISSMAKLGSKNPWDQKVGDKEYLAKITAGIILMKLPNNLAFVNPLKDGKKTSGFGTRYFKKLGKKHFHKGVDIAMKEGSKIISPLAGKVIVVSDRYLGKEAFGKTIVLEHDHGIVTKYFHLNAYHVSEGEKIAAGDVIGEVGNTGRSTGPHLHLEMYVNNELVNPEAFL